MRDSSAGVEADRQEWQEAAANPPEPTEAGVVRTYGRFAPLYDRVFGRVLEPGRRALAEALTTLQPASALEVGVGTGLTLAGYPSACRLVGIDLSPDMLERARRRAGALPGRDITLHAMNAERMDFADDSFDCVTLPYVLSVTPDPARLTAELRRVCKPGGDIFVLNHFSGGNAVWAPLERLVSGLAARIGFRSEFPFAPHMQHPDWTVLSVRKVNLLGLTTLVHLKNQPAG